MSGVSASRPYICLILSIPIMIGASAFKPERAAGLEYPDMGSIGLYADTLHSSWCVSGGQYAIVDIYVIVQPDGDGAVGAEFRVDVPPEAAFTGTEYNEAFTALPVGTIYDGVLVSYRECQRDWHWVVRLSTVLLEPSPSVIRLDVSGWTQAEDLRVVSCVEPDRPGKPVYRRSDLYINQCGYAVWPPYVEYANATAADAVTLGFLDPVQQSESEDVDDYIIYNSSDPAETIGVVAAAVQPDGKTVDLSLASGFIPGEVYTLEVGDDTDTTAGYNRFSLAVGLCADLELRAIETINEDGQDNSRFRVGFTVGNAGALAADPFTVRMSAVTIVSGAVKVLWEDEWEEGGLEASEERTDTLCMDIAGVNSTWIELTGEVYFAGPGTECDGENNMLVVDRAVYAPQLGTVEDVYGQEKTVTFPMRKARNDYEGGSVVMYEVYMRRAADGAEDCGCEPGPCGDWARVMTFPADGRDRYVKTLETPCDALPGDSSCVFDFKVCAVDVPQPGDTLRHWSELRTGRSLDHVLPARPSGFSAMRQAGDMYLFWDANSEPDLSGYRLYRSPYLFGGWTLLAETAGLDWLDTGWSETSGYCYRLTARDETGNEGYSSLACPEGFASKLLAALSAAFEAGGVRIDWSLLETADGVTFHISRSEDGGPWRAVSSVAIERGKPDYTFRDRTVEPAGSYSYRIEFEYDGARYFLVETGEVETSVPTASLGQNVPNPFNPSTTISFSIPEETDVKIDIFDVSGRLVRRLVSKPMPAGTHAVEWDGTDSSGSPAVSGVYFYRLSAGREMISRKMVLLR